MNNAIPFRAVMDVLDRLESEAAGGAPVCVAIVNRTGKLAAFLSLDGTPERAGAIAQSKAYTAMRMELIDFGVCDTEALKSAMPVRIRFSIPG